jgi:serine/threonine protein kinase
MQIIVWLAPEIMKKEQYTEKADVYSFGIILWELLVRNKPFDEYEVAHSQFISALEDEIIVNGLRPTIPPDCPTEYRELICDCWQGDPKRRPNFEEICRRLNKMKPLVHQWQDIPPTPLH